ncbi:TonB-dependent receptor [Pseudoxanthomonas sp.]|uniref:TonB-dependent receptor n=1 Tax=Pseudoxanthomonas sp. TaxID=1871049 RepID=UPI002602266A|nr:TonB-dependent receptor [Pseudoxanthomonas sp.]WDS38010.1 MAG: TonB-dependent receptor [Pseudoxanthomonas sp.]
MKKTLLASALAVALMPSAWAQDASTGTTTQREAAPSAAIDLDAVSVIGRGEARQVQRISQKNLDILPPGTSLQKALNVLPGVNAQSVDALGSNEQSMTLSLRGFNSTRLGYTLDGIPMGDGAYNNYNGLTINRALISENMAGAELAEGIGNLGTPSSSNLGGTISYSSSNPDKERGARVTQTLGSDQNRRTFVRVDTGEHNGFSAYLSGMNASSDLWNNQSAYNESTTKQLNAKGVWAFERGRISAFVDTSRTSQADYFYLSKNEMGRGLGWDWGGYAPDWDKAVAKAYCNAASYNAARCDASGQDKDADGAFTAGQILRNDNLYSLSGDFFLGDTFTLHALGYHHDDDGEGHNWNSGAYSNKGTAQELPIIFRNTIYSIDRNGGTLGFDWTLGDHVLQAGVWYERNTSSAERYQTTVDGPRDMSGMNNSQADTGVFAQQTRWETKQAFVMDTWHLLDDHLTLEGGAKLLHATADARALPGTARTPISPTSNNQFSTGSLKASKSFLPSIGANYRLTDTQEVFASFAKNIAMFQGGFKLGPQAVSQATWDQQATLQPEESRTLEAGYRFSGDTLQASLAAYTVRFDNRLLQYNPCDSRQPVGPTCGNRFYNVGGVDSRGAELTVIWSPSEHFSWYNSASLNRSTYASNYTQAGVVQQIKGKIQTDTPKQMFASELTWRDGGWYASLRGKYTGERFYTYTNDRGFGGFTVFDAAGGYDFGQVGLARNVRLSFNLTNLTDKRYASNLDSSVFAPTDATGSIYVFHASAPRQVFGSIDVRF